MFRYLRTPSLGLILALALLHGLLYIFLVPPWQHYDEPAHFEYAWLLANRSGLPQPGDYDQTMRHAVATSMIEHNFFRDLGFLPDLEAKNEPIWIGISQIDDFPLYYQLVSLPLRLISSWDVTGQMYAGRFVSLVLYLVSIVAAWGIMRELVPAGHPLHWMVPISMALLPGYTDLMTAVNNDVGATMLFSLFLWSSVCLICRGFTFPHFLGLTIAAFLCLKTKETIILALPLVGFVMLLTLFRNRWRWVPWIGLIALISVFLISIFSWGDALSWYRSSNIVHEKPTRVFSPLAPLGSHVIQIKNIPDQPPDPIFQLLPEKENNALRGKTVTIGAWVWATKRITIFPFVLYDGRNSYLQWVEIGRKPKFISMSATLPEDASRTRLLLWPKSENNNDQWVVFYDGLVMVEGARPLDETPQFYDTSAEQGTWGGTAFHNLLRNASGESVGLRIQPWAIKLSSGRLPNIPYPTLVLGALLDWRGSGWYYQSAAQNLLNTFWAKFGWSHTPLIPFTDQSYFILSMITVIGLGGAGVKLLRRGFSLPLSVLLFLGVIGTAIWAQAFLRGFQSLIDTVFIPSARYAYPVIIPTMLALNTGWLEIMHFLERWAHLTPRAKFWVYGLFFLALDFASLSSVFYYYYIR